MRGGNYARGGVYSARGGAYSSRGGVYYGGSRAYGGARFYGGRFNSIAPVRFYRPYYTFRPHFHLGIGLWVGYPFAYTYPYYDPFYYGYPYDPYAYIAPTYPYDAPYAPSYPAPYPPATTYPATPYGSAPQYNTQVAPPQNPSDLDQSNLGGLSFDIMPSDAQIIVDGQTVGNVGQFTATSQPLGVPAGHHHVELRAPGYQTMSFDVDIVAGQVIPYQGTLQR